MDTQTQSVVVGRYRLEVGDPAGTRLQFAATSSRTDPWALASALAASPARRPHAVEELSADVERLAASSAAVESAVAVLAAGLRGDLADGAMRDREISLLLGVLERLDRDDRHKEALQIARTLATLLALLERWSALVETLRFSIRVARASGDRPGEAWALHELGTLSACAGRRSEARDLLGRARTLRLALQDEAGLAATEQNLAMSAGRAFGGVLRNVARSPRRACVLSALAAATVGGAVGTVAAAAISASPANAGQGTTTACSTRAPVHTHAHTTPTRTTPTPAPPPPPPPYSTTSPPPTSDPASTSDPPPVDTTGPALVLAYPKYNERVESSALVFSGVGGTAPGDLSTVSISVYPGADTNANPVATYTAALDNSGNYGLEESQAPLTDGAYTAVAVQADKSGNSTTDTAPFTVYTAS